MKHYTSNVVDLSTCVANSTSTPAIIERGASVASTVFRASLSKGFPTHFFKSISNTGAFKQTNALAFCLSTLWVTKISMPKH